MTIRYVDPKSIIIGQNRQRTKITEIDNMMQSIKRIGILHPIVVNETMEGLELVSGERRLTAALALNLTTVPIKSFIHLSKTEVKLIELEENVKRQALPWRDQVKSTHEIHELYKFINSPWTYSDTARELSIHETTLRQTLKVFKYLNNPILEFATSIDKAYQIILRAGEIVAQKTTAEIFQHTKKVFETKAEVKYIAPEKTVLHANFLEWCDEYKGQKFNLLHCDFIPEDHAILTEKICENVNKLMSYSSHMILWFEMKYYSKIMAQLQFAGLTVDPAPIIWHKTAGVEPSPQPNFIPRESYKCAFICSKGNRALTNSMQYSYAGPKRASALRHILSSFVDETTVMLDPACGLGESLIAAENIGVKAAYGIDLDPNTVKLANDCIAKARVLRLMGK